jgi:hypothetical protein
MTTWWEYRWGSEFPTGKTMVEVAMAREVEYGINQEEEMPHPENCAECRGSVGLGVVDYAGGEMPSQLDKLRDERGAYYGDVLVNQASIGAVWGAILVQAATGKRWKIGEAVPPEIVCLMMVGVKLSRESFRHKTDNIDDAQNYLEFADEMAGATR